MTNFLIMDVVFNSSNKIKEAICYAATNNHYEISFIKCDQTRYIIKYCINTCKLRLHASCFQLVDISIFVICIFIFKYTCISIEYFGNQHTSTNCIASNMKKKLDDTLQYRIVDIQKDN